MKKYSLIVILILVISFLTSCSGKKSIDTSKEYLDEYYNNYNSSNYTQCFYQLNNNSADMLSNKYGVNAEEYLEVRKGILGQSIKYDIVSEEYTKVGKDKFVDFVIDVQYQSLIIRENIQIIIKKDKQISINVIEFGEDHVINNYINNFNRLIISKDNESIISNISPVYFEIKTKRNLTDILKQANNLGGHLNSCEILESKYEYEKIDNNLLVYSAMIKMNYENKAMINKVKIYLSEDGLGVGNLFIFPEPTAQFLENYTVLLNESRKSEFLSLYSDELWGDNDETQDVWWRRINKYINRYGAIKDYEIINMGTSIITNRDNVQEEVINLELNIIHEEKQIKSKLILINSENHTIYDQFFNDD